MDEKIKKQREGILDALEAKPQKVVINVAHGGFGLSLEAIRRYAELKGFKIFAYKQIKFGDHFSGIKAEYARIDMEEDLVDSSTSKTFYDLHILILKSDMGKIIDNDLLKKAEWFHDYNIKRDDPDLIQVVEELKEKANGPFASLKIVEIPYGIKWIIEEYDGWESVEEVHRSWD